MTNVKRVLNIYQIIKPTQLMMLKKMNLTPEEFQEFKDWYCNEWNKIYMEVMGESPLIPDSYDENGWLRAYEILNAYYEHRVKSKNDVIRKIEIYIETTNECLENFGLPNWAKETIQQDNEMLKLALSELQKLTASQERVKELEDDLKGMNIVRDVFMANKVEEILKPEYMNTVFTWQQIRDAIMFNNNPTNP